MLPYNIRTSWQLLLVMISILAVLDASTVSPQSTATVTVNSAAATHRPTTSVTERSSILNQLGATSPALRRPTTYVPTVARTTSTSLTETNEPIKRSETKTTALEATFTTQSPNSSHPSLQSSENPTTAKLEATTQTVQSPNSATMPPSTHSGPEVLTSQITAVPGSITCLGLGHFPSNSKVVCFQYEEETTCETLDETKKEKLRSLLCEVMNTTLCNVTIHSSEVNPKCILWVPTTVDAKDRLHTTYNQLHAQMTWGQISDHQTRSQKTMIALVTCGVLLAAFILAGYFLSNRESWSPGRQRLGEDPYCTETDSQGNTLVSVSAHAQDKPNNGTRENGTGQTVVPASTNGHSTKKQTVSDTEL